MKDLLINIFFDKSVIPINAISQDVDIVDFSGKMQGSFNIVNVSEIENFSNIYNTALSEFVKILASLSMLNFKSNNVRDFQFLDLPIYWLTQNSLKHPHLHWLINVFILKEIILQLPAFFKNYQSITMFFYKENSIIIDILGREIIKDNVSVNFTLLKKKSKFKSKITFYKTIIRLGLNSIKRNKTSLLNNKIKDVLLITPPKPTNYTSLFFRNIKELALKNNKHVFQTTYSHYLNSQSCDSISPILTFFDFFRVINKIFRLKLKIWKTSISNNNDNYNYLTLIKSELLELLTSRINYFFMYYSFKKLSAKITKQTKIFYEDEFYETGRIISKAFSENENCKTFGIQHASISEEHTVYNISDIEITSINKRDGLPVPDKFIVWGNYFKTFFLKNNSISEEYVIPAGNITYINNHKSIAILKTGENPKILYCLTSKALFIKELPLIHDLLQIIGKTEISFRFHPLWKFEVEFIKKALKMDSINISKEKEIKNSIINSDIIITSAHSTVFIDALVYKKPVIRLITKSDTLPDNLYNIYNCRSSSEFKLSYNKILRNRPKANSSELELLNLDRTIWEKLIKS